MRILIVKVSALGDIVHALPVLDYLHQVAPGAEIDWVVEAPYRDLLEGHPQLRQVYTVRTKAWRARPFAPATWREASALRRELLDRSYDLAFDLQGNIKSGIIARLSGAERRYGFDAGGVRETPNLMFTTHQVPLRPEDSHIASRALRVASAPFGRDYRQFTLQTEIYTPPEDDAAAEALLATLSDGLVFLFHQGTTWETKLWLEDRWVQLGRLLLERHADASILLSWGNEGERQSAERIAREIGAGARLLPPLTIKGFAALLKKVDLVAGGDTGPVHMAAAVGTPTVSFYRVTDPKRNAPAGPQHLHVQTTFHCRGCLRKECDRDGPCRESIKAETMLAAMEKLLFP